MRSSLGRCYVQRPDIKDPRNGFGSVIVKADNTFYDACTKLETPKKPPGYLNIKGTITGTGFADGNVGFCCGDVDDLMHTGTALYKDPVVQALFCDNYGVFQDMVPQVTRADVRSQVLKGVLKPLPGNLMLPGMVSPGLADPDTGAIYYYNLHDTICGTAPPQARSTDTRDRSVKPFKPTAPPMGPDEHTFAYV